MGLEADEMKRKLVEIYERKKFFPSGKEKHRFFISKEDFKKIAGKSLLREVFFEDVVRFLREDGYILVDLRGDDKGGFAVIGVDYIMTTCEPLSDEITAEYEYEKPDEHDEDYETDAEKQNNENSESKIEL